MILIKSPSFYRAFILLLLLLLSFVLVSLRSEENSIKESKDKKSAERRVSFVFVGDIMFHGSQIKAAKLEGGKFDFSPSFRYVSSILKQADFAAGNLETTFGGEPYSGYPAFSAPDTIAWFLKQAGFNVLTTANNHSSDKGRRGLTGTLKALERLDFIHTGIFYDEKSKEQLSPVYLEKNGLKVALLNYTYGTNNGGVGLLINKIDTTQMAQDIKKAKSNNADAVIVSIHWGNEYERKPNVYQKKIADFLFRQGVNAIIGSHPHVIQGLEKREYYNPDDKTEAFCIYSLGNFISNQRWRYSDGGLLVKFNIVKRGKSLVSSAENFAYEPCWVHTYFTGSRKYYDIVPASELQNDTARKSKMGADYFKMKQFIEDTRSLLESK